MRGGEVRGGEGRRRIKAVRSRVRLYRDQLPTIKQFLRQFCLILGAALAILPSAKREVMDKKPTSEK